MGSSPTAPCCCKHKAKKNSIAGYKLCAFPDDLIGREIAVTGTYEAAGAAAVEWLCERRLIKNPQDSVFLDIGANVGVYTIALADFFKTILAFEPYPTTSKILSLNIEINNVKNVTILNYGLSDKNYSANLYEGSPNNLGASSLKRGKNSTKRHVVVLRHAASAISEVTNSPIGFIKIDVEGHEIEVINGLREVISKQLPIIAFEANDKEHNQEIMEILTDIGYTKFLALDYKYSAKNLLLRVFLITIFGVKTQLKPVENIDNKNYSLIFALSQNATKILENFDD